MTFLEAIEARHSVRAFTQLPIQPMALQVLRSLADEINAAEPSLHIQLVTDEPRAFNCFLAHYGKFSNVTNYFAMVGKRGATLDELVGYHGERLVLEAQRLGLNTCWVALSYKKIAGAFDIAPDEKLCVVIAVGYGLTPGVSHKIKPLEKVASTTTGEMPEWFVRAVNAALLAPTALNQQKFHFTLHDGDVVEAKASTGFYTRIDLGIVKRHFEIAAQHPFTWK